MDISAVETGKTTSPENIALSSQRLRPNLFIIPRGSTNVPYGVFLDGNLGVDDKGVLITPTPLVILDHHFGLQSIPHLSPTGVLLPPPENHATATTMSLRFWIKSNESGSILSGLKALKGEGKPFASDELTLRMHINHLDVDSVLSVWAFRNPKAAKEKTSLLEAISRFSDFFMEDDQKYKGYTPKEYAYIIDSYMESRLAKLKDNPHFKSRFEQNPPQSYLKKINEIDRQLATCEYEITKEQSPELQLEIGKYMEKVKEIKEFGINKLQDDQRWKELQKDKQDMLGNRDLATITKKIADKKRELVESKEKLKSESLMLFGQTLVLNHMLDKLDDILSNPQKYEQYLKQGMVVEEKSIEKVKKLKDEGRLIFASGKNMVLIKPGQNENWDPLREVPDIYGLYAVIRQDKELNRPVVVCQSKTSVSVALNPKPGDTAWEYDMEKLWAIIKNKVQEPANLSRIIYKSNMLVIPTNLVNSNEVLLEVDKWLGTKH